MHRVVLGAVLCFAVCGARLAWAELAPAAPSDAGPPADHESPREEPEATLSDDMEAIRRDIAALQGLIDGRPVEVLAPRGLLGVDATDDRAVARRLNELDNSLSQARAERDALAARSEVDGGPPVTSSDASVGGADVEGDGAEDAEASRSELLTEEERSRLVELELLIERDRLVETFLSLPASDRQTALRQSNPALEQEAEELETAAGIEAEAEAAIESAEADERAALEESASADNEGVRRLASERARVHALHGAVAEHRLEYARQREQLARLVREHAELVGEVRRRIAESDFTEADAEALDEQVVESLTTAGSDLQEAFYALDEPSRHEPLGSPLDLDDFIYRDHRSQRDALSVARARLDRDVGRLLGEEEEYRWVRVEALADSIARLDNVWYDLLPLLSRTKRERVMGLGDVGIAQLNRELQYFSLVARLFVRRLPRTGRELLNGAVDVLSRSSTRWDVLFLVIIAICALQLITRRKQWWPRIRGAVSGRVAGLRLEKPVDRSLRTFDAIGLPLGVLVLLWLSFLFLGDMSRSPVVPLARAVLMSYAWYRVALAAAHHFFITAAEAGPRILSETIKRKIYRTVQAVGSFALVVNIFLVISSHLLGRGYLYALVVELFWVAGAIIAYLLFRTWRNDIFDTYIATFAKNALVKLVKRYRDRYWSVALLLPTFLHLASHAVWVYLNETALHFERTRRALAYLFRKRLERSRKKSDGVDLVVHRDLPEELTTVFERDIENREVLVDHFPKLEKTLRFVERWKQSGRGTTIALVGEGGIGKTTWLQELRIRSGVETSVLQLEETLLSEESICRALARALEMDDADEIDTVDRFVKAIDEGPRRLLMLDNCENLVLRTIGGLGGLGAFSRIMARTVGRVVWVCSFSRYIWEYVEFVLRQQSPFRHIFILRGWTDETLGDLINARMAHCGIEATYGRMLADEGIGAGHPDSSHELDHTRERFLRLLWDYTDGVPRVAMHYWLRSLTKGEDGTVNVGLFDSADSDHLERLQEQGRFMLHTVVSHESLTVEGAMRVLGYRRGLCLALLELLRAEGYIKRSHDRYRVTVHWAPEVIRFLRRKHLLFT